MAAQITNERQLINFQPNGSVKITWPTRSYKVIAVFDVAYGDRAWGLGLGLVLAALEQLKPRAWQEESRTLVNLLYEGLLPCGSFPSVDMTGARCTDC